MSAESIGKVILVGAGPGDPGLLTVRGLAWLRKADLVLYDGLVNPMILQHTLATAERTCRADGPKGRVLKQEEINARLIAAAQQGKIVVRLKGGDPFVFGRGSEEAAALHAAGIPFEVVPGVTAAVAASAYAGISLTHRNISSAVAFVTGHEDPRKKCISLASLPGRHPPVSPGKCSDQTICLDYHALAAFPGTLVFYMGLHRLPEIVAELLNCGKSAATPACVISRGTLPSQRTVVATLGTLVEQIQPAALHAPSLIVVGECVQQREQIAWYERLPLFGLSIGIARPAAQAACVAEKVLALGGQPVLLPTIEIKPPEDWLAVDAALPTLASYDWIIFTSVNGVQGLLQRLWLGGGDARSLGGAKLAAIGEGSARALEEYCLRADVVPEEFRAEALAAKLTPRVAGRRVLWVRANRGREVLTQALREAGAHLDELVVYQNCDLAEFPPETADRLCCGEIDWIGLSSPSIARNFARLCPAEARPLLGGQIRLASISPVTTAAACAAGLPISAEATRYTWDGILQAIVGCVSGETPGRSSGC